MLSSQTKIITKLSERRQIEIELRKMLAAATEQEFRSQAQKIAQLGSQVLPTIIANLDRADARLLTALGAVAALLNRDEVVQSLRQVVLDPGRSDRAKRGALTLLERFLGQPVDDELLESFQDPEEVVISSLDEVLVQAERNPAALIGYIQRLDQQEPDVVLALIRTLQSKAASLPSTPRGLSAIELLRMMAQDVRDEIAAAAVQALGTLRLPEAAKALQTLIPILAPALRPGAERCLRKLQFSGVTVTPLSPPSPAWRALIGPVNGLGQRNIWFVQDTPVPGYARFLNLLLSDQAGAVRAAGHAHVPIQMLPPRRPCGYVHDIAWPDGSGAMLLLEAPFDLGRRIVLEALTHNRATQIPVAGPLRLLSPWLWDTIAENLEKVLPDLGEEEEKEHLVADSDRLVEHPAFADWTVQGPATWLMAEELLRHPAWDLEILAGRLMAEILTDETFTRVLAQRLEAMSEWLLWSGEQVLAKMALAASQAMQEGRCHELAFLRALVRRDLEMAFRRLQEDPLRVSDTEPLKGV